MNLTCTMHMIHRLYIHCFVVLTYCRVQCNWYISVHLLVLKSCCRKVFIFIGFDNFIVRVFTWLYGCAGYSTDTGCGSCVCCHNLCYILCVSPAFLIARVTNLMMTSAFLLQIVNAMNWQDQAMVWYGMAVLELHDLI